ncbi:MAG TPA: thiamine pyrophosphate-binding protein [Gemmatimonadaceae bacterium]
MREQSGAERIIEVLTGAGVKYVFGLPGTQTLALFEALRKSPLQTILTTSELTAGFMAGGLARVTGKPGVIVTIPGPGFMWALPGVAEALLDSVPLVHISGSPIDEPVGRTARQQELLQAAIAAPLVKAVVDAGQYADPGEATREALRLSRTGEPGPVLLHVSSATMANAFEQSDRRPTPPTQTAGRSAFTEVIARLRSARRPIFIFGQGANPHSRVVRRIVERVNAPLLVTPSARGLLPETHPLSFPFGAFVADMRALNDLIDSSDLVLAAGCKLGNGSTGGFELRLPADRFIHIDASREVVGSNYPASIEIVADIGDLLAELASSDLRPSSWTSVELESWRARIAADYSSAREPLIAGTSSGTASEFFNALGRGLPDDAILVLDSGLHQVLARRYYKVLCPNGLIIPTDLQSMGFAIPTAIGARLGAPARSVVALLGDGGFAMTGLELLTAVREKIALVVIVFVDDSLGQIRMQQLANYGATHGVALQNPDLQALAASIGVRYERAGDDIETVIRNAVGRQEVTLVEVAVGDTLKIRGHAALVRTGEATKRLIRPRLFRILRAMLRQRR